MTDKLQLAVNAALSEALSYCPQSGNLTWNHRPKNHFKSERGWRLFNTKFAGKVAGTISDQGYLKINIGGVIHRAHRIAWFLNYGRWPEGDIDHINHVRADNRIVNLREVSRKENQRNQRQRSTNSSGHNGIHWRKDCQKWRAMIMVDGKSKHLGYFSSIDEAVAARNAADSMHGFHHNHGAMT